MSQPITIPSVAEIRQRIGDCRTELAALKKLLQMAVAAEQAREARHRREVHHASR